MTARHYTVGSLSLFFDLAFTFALGLACALDSGGVIGSIGDAASKTGEFLLFFLLPINTHPFGVMLPSK